MTRLFPLDQIGTRLQALRDLHRRYDQAADTEAGRRYPDGLLLKRLKVARLAVRDEIVALERRLTSAAAPGTGRSIPVG
ncbi:hypothetical protein SAE02_70370 [Skermanella aerolata]|uniref:DUF465 domain-containing protein n=1 Tax=Skermanella aerolata TaxID=393310 RepID=A0A512E2D6_9PROT|nr:YdcH family protein [Skermanella aerolata]KJB91398.1 hypothetical protein N826_30605 [Skermanella aerolata KACC 11604]GEO42889.1 hypothetical protein SAE02_70370 [Skermanella aerolata]